MSKPLIIKLYTHLIQKIIAIDLNSIDISEYRSSHFVKLLVQLNIERFFEIITLCFPRIMR